MTPPITSDSNGTHFTQPPECYNSRDAVSVIPSNVEYYNQVPLYQTKDHHRDMKAVLQSCCMNGVWITEDPDPCTAICDSRTSAEAKKVMYCLNAQQVVHGTKTEKISGAVRRPAVGWVSWMVGGMLLSGMLI
ncbi:hypothetical protein PDIG_03560 [Penicillium digitatum PHI26]|uniref:Uncharacterized protein n=2 Tax=Penicillium digitatum TaxID=36651 RepID=K9H209_PEND2|nr:hypothetical protein PDIP_08240 [Penicillium digitatum Pd1]EKV19196.1 hypothetical protein PDIG_03560 [Penicillium digitatum PHI26]EKV21251.1 hypothetical protein PDIP_08240 [Penicillium digitatum Pd1]